MQEQGIMLIADDEHSGYRAVFEDDGRAAYAYLVKEELIDADVWLYNRGESPVEPEWSDESLMPFKNPRDYVTTETIAPVTDAEDVEFAWTHTPNGELEALDVLIRGEIVGRLKPGAKPGWARLARLESPLAKPLVL